MSDLVVDKNRDLNTMPVRDLIAEMREEVKGHPEEIVRQLVLMALTNRIEEQADRADAAQKKLVQVREACREIHDLLYHESRQGKQCRSCGFWGGYSHAGGCRVEALEKTINE